MIHRAAVVLVFTAVICHAWTAAAQGSDDEECFMLNEHKDCRAAWALSSLRVGQRAFIQDMCSGKLAEGRRLDHIAEEERRLYRGKLDGIAKRLSAAGGWQLAAFYQLIPKCVIKHFAKRAHSEEEEAILKTEDAIQNTLKTLRAGLAEKDKYKDLKEEIQKRVEGSLNNNRTLTLTSIWRRSDDKPEKRLHACLSDEGSSSFLEDLQSYYPVSLISDSPKRKPVVYSGFPLRRMPITEEPIPIENQFLYLSVLRRNEPYVINLRRGATDYPIIETGHGTKPITLPKELSKEPVCLDLDLAVDPGAIVLIDGAVIKDRSGPLLLPHQDHTVTVMQKTPKGWAVQHEETVESPLYKYRLQCHRLRFDLRSSRAITLTRIKVEETCDLSAASPGMLWGEAALYLKENEAYIGMRFRDLRTVANMVKYLSSLQHALTSNTNKPKFGAPRGSAATDSLIEKAAHELWRQGIGKVVSLELQCPPARVDSQQDKKWWKRQAVKDNVRYSLLGWSVDINKLYNEIKDPIKGADLRHLVTMQNETVDEPPQLERATRRVVARLVGIPYLRFITSRRPRQFHERIELFLEHVRGQQGRPQPIHLDAYQFAHHEDDSTCDLLERTGRLAGRVPTKQSLGPAADVLHVTGGEGAQASGAAVRSYMVEIRPRRSGTILVKAALGPKNNPVDTVYRCVTVKPTLATIWARVGFGLRGVRDSRQPGGEKPDSWQTPYTSTYAGAHVGWGVYLDQLRAAWLLGSYVGTTTAVRAIKGPLSWDYLPNAEEVSESNGEGTLENIELDFNRDGSLNLAWDRQSLDFGLSVAYQGSICRLFALSCGVYSRSIDLFIGVDIGLNLGFIEMNRQLRNLLALNGREVSEDPKFDVDFDAAVHLGLGYHATNRLNLNILFGILLPALDDYAEVVIGKRAEGIMQTISFDFAVVPNLSIRVGYDI
ncbi:MAG: hypothetical protein GY854_33170 [Deltaproteobacteria bacterium]|nr:hypothetical protein [Deltaproteobacteria bacterium]